MQLTYLVNTDTERTLESVRINSVSVFSLFQALRKWIRRERERHAKSWRGGKKEEVSSFCSSFPPFYFRVCAFFNSANPTVSEHGTGPESVVGGIENVRDKAN